MACNGSGADLIFVARLLGEQGAMQGTVADTGARRAAHKRSRGSSAHSDEAQPSDQHKALLARYSRPSNRPNSKQYFCEACECSVAAREHDWFVHVSGIKHKRQLLSLLHTGQRGNCIVSLFEAKPGSASSYKLSWHCVLSSFMTSVSDTPMLTSDTFMACSCGHTTAAI